MKKLFFPAVLLILTVFTFTTCDLINGLLDDDNNNSQIENSYELYTNPGDPTIMKATDSDGVEYMFYGIKDTSGGAEKINMITVQYPDDQLSYQILINDDGTPGKMYTPEGSSFEFIPLSEKELMLNVVSKTGAIRLHTKINLDSLQKSLEIEDVGQSMQKYAFRRTASEIYSGAFTPASDAMSVNVEKKTAGAKLILNLSRCGHPITSANYLPVMMMKPPIGKTTANVPAINGNGVFTFNLPDPSLPSSKIEKTCNKIGKALDKLCLAAAFAPWSVSTLVNKLIEDQFPNASDKESITKISSKVTKIVPQLCKIRDEVNIADFCDVVGEIYLNPNPDQYTYTMVLLVSGGIVDIPVSGFDPNTGGTISYDIPADFDVTDLYTEPQDPSPSEGYVAYAVITCPDPQGTEVTISVFGSDGYTNSYTTTLTEAGSVSLSVPGGAESVEDMIVVDAEGQEWSTFIVF